MTSQGQLPSRLVRGDIVWAFDPFKRLLSAFENNHPVEIDPHSENPRPFVIVNTEAHPFYQDEFLAMLITTTQRSEALELRSHDYKRQPLPKQSYISPWVVVTLKRDFMAAYQTQINEQRVDDAVQELHTYL